MYVNPEAVTKLLNDIKALWDEHGLGDDDSVSEPLYHRLCDALEQLTDQPVKRIC